jgi:hypothetical protein
MATDVERALEAWRRAEAAFTAATSRFLALDIEPNALTKEGLIDLMRLRRTADAARESYFLLGDHDRGGPPTPPHPSDRSTA